MQTSSTGIFGSVRLGAPPDRRDERKNPIDGDAPWHVVDDGEPEEGRDVHERLTSTIARIYRAQDWRRRADLHHARMYSAVEMPGLGRRSRTPVKFAQSRLAFNVTKNACDTLTAKIAKSRPLPMFLTNGGNWKQKRKARGLSKFVEGQFAASKVFETIPAVVLDTSVYGTGFVKVVRDGTRISVDRIYPWELLVDEAEGIYGTPACIYQIRWIDRRKLMRMYPEKAGEIASCTATFIDSLDVRTANGTTADQVLVAEAWCTADGEESPGRRAVVIANATLEDEPYTEETAPILALRRQVNLEGFWGIGVAQELSGIQFEINVMATKLQRSHHLLGNAIWMLPESAGIPTGHISNELGLMLRYKGIAPPAVYTPSVIAPEAYNYLMQLIGKAYELAGISQLSATSQKPAGLNAGIALETYNDIETERFLCFGRNLENLCIDIARRMVVLGREIAEDEPGFFTNVAKKGYVDKIIFKDVVLPDDEYVIQVYPTSMLAKTPAARLDQVNVLAQNQWITAEEAKMLLDFPDLESVTWRESASYRMAEKSIDAILDDGSWTPPLPVMNLEQARKMALLAYLDAYQDEVEPAHLEMLLEWSDACLAYAGDGAANDAGQQPLPTETPPQEPGPMPDTPPAPQAPPMPPGAPPAVPMAA